MAQPLTPEEVAELLKRREFARTYKTPTAYREAVLARIDIEQRLAASSSTMNQINRCINHAYELCFDSTVPATHIQLMLDVAEERAANKDIRAGEIFATPDFTRGNQRRS